MPRSVTVMNDASLVDGQGAVHTWLELKQSGRNTEYFSFSNSDKPSLVGIDSDGISSVDANLMARKPTEKITITITKNQYDVLAKEFRDFYTRQPKPKYDLTPDNEGDFNCVTAARTILQTAGIYYLNNIQTPFGVKYKIKGGQSSHAIEDILKLRDDFDANAKEMIQYFTVFVTRGFDSNDILTRINFDRKRPVAIPYGSKNDQFADFYLNYGGNIDQLHQAARFGHLDIVKFVCESQLTDIEIKNANDNTPLHYAAKFGHINVVKYLIDEKRATFHAMNKVGMTPLHFASLSGNRDIVEYLVNKYRATNLAFNRNDNVYGASPFHYAASSGNLDLVRYFIENGSVDVNVRDYGDETALHYAVSPGGNLEIVKYLIQNGAIASIQSPKGPPLLHYAALGGHFEVMRYLIDDVGLDPNTISSDFHTLHMAIRGGNLRIVQYLIEEKRINVNLQGTFIGTALHIAAELGNIEIVRYLLKKGANTAAKNVFNKTPLDIATAKRHSHVVACLESVSDCISQRTRRHAPSEYNDWHTLKLNSSVEHRSQNLLSGESSHPGSSSRLDQLNVFETPGLSAVILIDLIFGKAFREGSKRYGSVGDLDRERNLNLDAIGASLDQAMKKFGNESNSFDDDN